MSKSSAFDVERVLDPRTAKLLRGETIKVRGMKQRLETKLWKLCVLIAIWIAIAVLQARQASHRDDWARADDGKKRSVVSLANEVKGEKGGDERATKSVVDA